MPDFPDSDLPNMVLGLSNLRPPDKMPDEPTPEQLHAFEMQRLEDTAKRNSLSVEAAQRLAEPSFTEQLAAKQQRLSPEQAEALNEAFHAEFFPNSLSGEAAQARTEKKEVKRELRYACAKCGEEVGANGAGHCPGAKIVKLRAVVFQGGDNSCESTPGVPVPTRVLEREAKRVRKAELQHATEKAIADIRSLTVMKGEPANYEVPKAESPEVGPSLRHTVNPFARQPLERGNVQPIPKPGKR